MIVGLQVGANGAGVGGAGACVGCVVGSGGAALLGASECNGVGAVVTVGKFVGEMEILGDAVRSTQVKDPASSST